MSDRVFDAVLSAVWRLTGIVLRKSWTRIVVPTGCDADTELHEGEFQHSLNDYPSLASEAAHCAQSWTLNLPALHQSWLSPQLYCLTLQRWPVLLP
jgi:hypothetical protein